MKTRTKVEPAFSRASQNPPPDKAVEKMEVPFLRPSLSDDEIAEVVDTLRSGWLTAGPKVKAFEEKFAGAVNASHAVALNSCTAALHLAVESLGLRSGQAVLVPTMTFAATAEVVLYKNAIPIMVDCDAVTGNMDLADARRKIEDVRAGRLSPIAEPDVEIVGVIPVHVGGYMIDVDELKNFAAEFNLWVVEDAAHAFPAAWRKNAESAWQYCGDNTSNITCFSFYANKTITTGEGGMAVTSNRFIAEKIRLMSLHGLSRDAWKRYTEDGDWDYLITEPGYKYNLTDIAASIGIHQLDRAEAMRRQRAEVAEIYLEKLADVEELNLPPDDETRLHSWHLFPVRLNLDEISTTRNAFISDLKRRGVGCSVHWRPLHLHPFYAEKSGWREHHLPTATALWSQLISLPIFPTMTTGEIKYVVETVKSICKNSSKRKLSLAA